MKSNTISAVGPKGVSALPKEKKDGFFSKYRKNYQIFLMYLPVIICLLVFNYGPMYGLTIAFKDFSIMKGIAGSTWVGFKNFRDLLMTPSFWEVFRNTLVISLLKILFGFPAPIILALMLNEVRGLHFKKFVQSVSYLPHFLSWVVLGGLFIQILSPSGGLVNEIICLFGGTPIYFVADSNYFIGMLVSTNVWKEIGWGSIVYLAAITSINPELYESAEIDGAGRFSKMWFITLPELFPIIGLMFILAMGNIVNAGFDQIFNLYNPAVYKVADIIDTYVYRKGLVGMRYSFASAADLFKNVISFALVFLANYIVRKFGEYSIW